MNTLERFALNQLRASIYLSMLGLDINARDGLHTVTAVLADGGEIAHGAQTGEILRHDGTMEAIVHWKFVRKPPRPRIFGEGSGQVHHNHC